MVPPFEPTASKDPAGEKVRWIWIRCAQFVAPSGELSRGKLTPVCGLTEALP